MLPFHNLITRAYAAFNSRNIDAALTTFHPGIEWPKAFEGGYVTGHDHVRAYWTRQWKEIDPTVTPVKVTERHDGKLEVRVHQLVKDLEGHVMFDGFVTHIYETEDGMLKRMHIEP